MENIDERKQFEDELGRRFDELQRWAIDHWPNKERLLSPGDFALARKALFAAGLSTGELDQSAPEPSEGGPQYTSVTPAPWP